MQNIRLITLTSTLMVSALYGAAYDFQTSEKMCEQLQQIIKKRSADDFMKHQLIVPRLHNDHIQKLRDIHSAYNRALKVIYELREIPQIAVELKKIVDEGENSSCLQCFYNLFPTYTRSRAINLHRQILGTTLGYALKELTSEYDTLSDEEVYTKVDREIEALHAIKTIITQKQDTEIRYDEIEREEDPLMVFYPQGISRRKISL